MVKETFASEASEALTLVELGVAWSTMSKGVLEEAKIAEREYRTTGVDSKPMDSAPPSKAKVLPALAEASNARSTIFKVLYMQCQK